MTNISINLVKDNLENTHQYADATDTVYYRMIKPFGMSQFFMQILRAQYFDRTIERDRRKANGKALVEAERELVEALCKYDKALKAATKD